MNTLIARMNLRARLIAATAIAAGVALLVAALAHVIALYASSRDSAREQLQATVSVVAANSAAALTFDDRAAAEKLLASMSVEDGIEKAEILDNTGRVFAAFDAGMAAPLSNGISGDTALAHWLQSARLAGDNIYRFDGLNALHVVVPVVLDTEVIGHVYAQMSLARLRTNLWAQIAIVLATTLIALLIAYTLAARLQRSVSEPLLHLVSVMRGVTEQSDYSLRAQSATPSQDEIGTLIAGFNGMIAQIEERENELKDHREHLEALVDERTAKLAEANRSLRVSMQENVAARRTAEAASRAKSEFLARMSHEIRTPMNGVLGMTELLLESQLSGQQRRFAETIQSSADALLAIINDILDFSKIEAGQLKLERRIFNLRQSIEDAVELFAQRAQEKQLELAIDCDPNMHCWVEGDELRLRQVLMNLVSNAIKFTGVGHVLIRANARRGERVAVSIEVIDSGIGIRPESLNTVFDSFVQEDGSTTRRFGGTGLGLAICRQLVTLMGGTLQVASTPGSGSTFRLDVDLTASENPSANTVTELCLVANKRVLIVDDNAINREIMESHLSTWGFRVTTAAGAAEADQSLAQMQARGEPPELLLVDWHMPERDGVEWLRELRGKEATHATPAIIVSSIADDFDAKQAHALEPVRRLSKPVRQSLLRRALFDMLGDSGTTATRDAVAPVDGVNQETELACDVLLVEDNPVNQMLAMEMLQRLGCRTVHASDGVAALDELARRDFDVVLMDCQMPTMDGITATQRLRDRESNSGLRRTHVVALTANALEGDRETCIAAGMDDYLSKPFSMLRLREVIARALAARAGEARAPLDRAALEAIRALDPSGDDRMLTRLAAMYCTDSARLMDELRSAVSSEDLEAAARAAHTLKATSAHLGATAVCTHAEEIERAGRAADLSAMRRHLPALTRAHGVALEQLASLPLSKQAS